MSYVKTNWVNGTTPVNADNMNKIEDQLEALDNEKVVANPTLAGTEDDLTGLQVGATKYKVPSGEEYTFTNGVTESDGVVSVDSTIARAANYLPLAGGTMTGPLTMNGSLRMNGRKILLGDSTTSDYPCIEDVVGIVQIYSTSGKGIELHDGGAASDCILFKNKALFPNGSQSTITIGTSKYPFSTVYSRNLSDGSTSKSMSTILGLTSLSTSKLDASKSAVANVGGLTTLSSSPSNPELVGIDTSNTQSRVTVGQGLSLTNGTLSATGGSGPTYSAGDGIDITNEVISIDEEYVALKSDLPEGEVNITLTSTSISDGTTTLDISNKITAQEVDAKIAAAIGTAIGGTY